jgi:hypothetical protein
MKKNIFIYIFSVLWLFSSNLCFGNNKDLLLKRNVFFEQGKSLLGGIEKIGSSSKYKMTSEIIEYNSLLQQTEILINKLSDNRLTTNNISSRKLDELVHQILDKKRKFLANENRFLTQERKETLGVVFDSMIKGILLDLSFDHLASLRESLILHLKNILFLKEYWKNEIEQASFWRSDSNALHEKLKNILFLKDRTACFIGKIDEILFSFFKVANDPAILNENLLDQVKNFTEQSIFTVYTFFSENFDPDKQTYNERLLEFCSFDFQQKIRLFNKNHINVCMAEESLGFQLKSFQTPSFLRRHWFALSATSLALAGAGVVVYRNREYLFGGKCNQDLNKFYDEYIKKMIFDPFIKMKDSIEEKFFPNVYLKENKDTMTSAAEGFKSTLKDSCTDLVNKKVLDSFDAEKDLNDLGALSKKLYAAFDTQKKKIFEDKYKDIQEILDLFKGDMKKLNEHLPNVFRLLGLIDDKDKTSTSAGEKEKEAAEGAVKAYAYTIFRLITLSKAATSNIKNLKEASATELDPALKGLLGVINQFTNLIENIGNEASAFVVWIKIIEAMACIYGIDASKRVVGMINLVEAIKRWVPIILTIITVYLITKKIYNHTVQERINRITLSVTEIYQILIRNKSEYFDIYQKDLKYKDQGMMSFWLEILNDDSSSLAKENRERISRLSNELQDPECSVSQKIEFVKLEWGKYLFGVQIA